MNSHLTHIVATDRAANLIRRAEQARLAKGDPGVERTHRPRGRVARAVVRLRLGLAGAS